MNVLEVLRDDMDDAGTEAWDCAENPVRACLAVLDEFSAGHEVVEVDHYTGPGDRRCWDDCVLSDRAPETIIVPRKPEPRITDHTLTERMAVLEDEVKHRCGCLGRRVNALEFKVGVKVGGKVPLLTLRGAAADGPLLEAAEVYLAWTHQHARVDSDYVAELFRRDAALTAAIKEERER